MFIQPWDISREGLGFPLREIHLRQLINREDPTPMKVSTEFHLELYPEPSR